MENIIKALKFAVTVLGGAVSFMLGGFDKLLITLLSLMALDYLSGIIKAVYNKSINSQIGFRGILKKVMIIMVVILVSSLQQITENNIPLRDITIMFYLTNEGISIIENLGVVIPIPKKLKDVFEQLKGEEQ